MGSAAEVICQQCAHRFIIRVGGGFFFHLLHCDRCGNEREVPFGEIGEAHFRFIKGLPGPYAQATKEHDAFVKENYPGPPLDEQAYHAAVEDLVGACKCEGRFRFDALPRCPECTSQKLDPDPDGEAWLYD